MQSQPDKRRKAQPQSLPRRLNLKDFAALLGVSISTVSRVLSGGPDAKRISEATRERIQKEAQKRGVIVNQLGRGLRLRQTKTIGLVIPNIANHFFASFACHVENIARLHGYAVLLCDTQESTSIEESSVGLLRARQVDGLILAPVGETHAHLRPLQEAGVPFVLVDRVFPRWKVPSVVSDNFNGVRLAVEHLVAYGHRRIGCVQGLPQSYSNRERLRGYEAALKKAGIPLAPLLPGTDFTPESGYRITRELCRNPQSCPTAILAMGNLLGLGAMRAIQECGLRIPQDISIIAFDEQPWAAFLSPALTTVAQPVEAMATEAFAQLLGIIKGDHEGKARTTKLPVDLILRESVRRLAPPTP